MNSSVAWSKGDAAAGPGLTHLFTMRAALGARLDGGDGPLGRRVFNAGINLTHLYYGQISFADFIRPLFDPP